MAGDRSTRSGSADTPLRNQTIVVNADIVAPSTRDALVASGREAFSARGYAGSSLSTIAGGAGLTTGAFYRQFASKAEFYAFLLDEYRSDLLAALQRARSLKAQIESWLRTAGAHRGVVRVMQELTIVGTPEAEAHSDLRRAAAAIIETRLRTGVGVPDSGPASLMVCDVVTQYAFMNAAGWIAPREPKHVAVELERLVKRGLYRR